MQSQITRALCKKTTEKGHLPGQTLPPNANNYHIFGRVKNSPYFSQVFKNKAITTNH